MRKLKSLNPKTIIYLAIPLAVLLIAFFLPRFSSKDGGTGEKTPTFSTRQEKDTTSSGGVYKSSDTIESYNTIANEGVYEPYTPPELTVAQQTKLRAMPHLPIYIESYETSVGITTTINIYNLSGDRSDTLRLEIYNIDYQNRAVDTPNAAAFKESFLKAKEELKAIDVDMNDVNFIFGTREHIQSTANYWVDTFRLL